MIHSAIFKYCLVVMVLLLTLSVTGVAQNKGKTKEGKKTKMDNLKEYAVIETTMGTIELEFYPADAPKTVENFLKLAEKKYFDGIIFHRISKGFVIQGGDPTGTGAGGKSIWGKEFDDELNPNTPSYKEGYKKGVVAMANRGPNTNTSQFFIMLRDNTGLPKNYTIFGKVSKGLDVVDAIGQVEIIPAMGPTDGKPKVDVVMKKVTIKREGAQQQKEEKK